MNPVPGPNPVAGKDKTRILQSPLQNRQRAIYYRYAPAARVCGSLHRALVGGDVRGFSYATRNRVLVVVLVKRSAQSGAAASRTLLSSLLLVAVTQSTLWVPGVMLSMLQQASFACSLSLRASISAAAASISC